MKTLLLHIAHYFFITLFWLTPMVANANPTKNEISLPKCVWCGASEAPRHLKSEIQLAQATEPGEPLHLSGTVMDSNGVPAPGILLYVYHTNAKGEYAKRGNETGNAQRHGYLRGWLMTDTQGHYSVRTIKPGIYPGREEPAHMHFTVKEPNREEYYVDVVVFEDDPQLSQKVRNKMENRGGSGIVALSKNVEGEWEGSRNIRLLAPSLK